MRRLDRFVIGDMILPFIAGTLVVVMMFQANAYIFIAKTFNVENIPLIARFQWILFETPSYLRMTLPVGTALAAALATTRMARESELTALRAAGASILRIIWPIFIFGAMVGVLNFYDVDRLVPIATRKADDLARKNEYLGVAAAMRSNTLLQLNKQGASYAASLGTVSRLKNDVLSISDIILIDRSDPGRTTIIKAGTGRYDRGVWSFDNALMYVLQGDDLYTLTPLGTFVISQEVSLDQIFRDYSTNVGDLEQTSTPELRKEIASSIATKGDPRPAQIELFERYAIPASCAVFSLTSPICSIFFARSGGFVGLLVSFVIVMLYYNAFVISTQILGKIEWVPAWVAAWLPNIVFAALGLIALRRLE